MPHGPQPVIILVEPQMGVNIGMCARAMLNCGLERLRLVNPRDGWPQDSARASAADADVVIDGTEVFGTLEESIADCHRVYATTARERTLSLPVMTAEAAAGELAGLSGAGEQVAILFGPEASGLDTAPDSRQTRPLLRNDCACAFALAVTNSPSAGASLTLRIASTSRTDAYSGCTSSSFGSSASSSLLSSSAAVRAMVAVRKLVMRRLACSETTLPRR